MVEHALLFRTESNFYFISYIVFNMIIHLSNVKKADMQNKKKRNLSTAMAAPNSLTKI